jgi:hypothetical protein
LARDPTLRHGMADRAARLAPPHAAASAADLFVEAAVGAERWPAAEVGRAGA